MFAFTSMGGRVDGSINHSKGPYVFRMCGQNYHRIGSLLPEIGKRPQFAKLYIYDTENEINNRMNCLLEGDIDPEIVQGLSVMLEEHNILVKTFRMARDRLKSILNVNFSYVFYLIGQRMVDNIIYPQLLK